MKPNIVFILSDDQGAWALHCAGNKELLTPNIDRLSAEGLLFDSFYCASPVCSPARASLMTGRMPCAHGVLDWLRSGNIDAVRFSKQGKENPYGGYADENEPIAYLDGIPCYTDMLARNGYTCALSGKWHLGDSVRPQKSFSDWYTIGQGGCFYYHPDIVENGQITVRHGQYITDLITDRAVSDIHRLSKSDAPFYLSVHYTAPHNPWNADQHPKKWIDYYDKCAFDDTPDVPDHPDMTTGPVYGTPARKENLRGYYAAISAMDEGIGRIISALESEGIFDETLVIFTADNGMCMGHHGVWGKGNGTFPLNMYEQSVKVPFIARCPALIADPGRVVSDAVSAVDLYPTLSELMDENEKGELAGESFYPVFAGGHSRRREVMIFDEYGPVRMIRRGKWKYIHRYPYGKHELYDLESDPDESNNLFGLTDTEAVTLELRHSLEAFFEAHRISDFDSKSEGVTGTGQMCLPGKRATRLKPYGNIPVTRKEI